MRNYTTKDKLDVYVCSFRKWSNQDTLLLHTENILSLVRSAEKVINDLKKEEEVLEIEIPFLKQFKNGEIGFLGVKKCLLLKGEIIKLSEETLFESQKYKELQERIEDIRLDYPKLDFYIKCKSEEVWKICPNDALFKLDDNNLEKIIFKVQPNTDECLKKALSIIIHYGILELFKVDFEVECI